MLGLEFRQDLTDFGSTHERLGQPARASRANANVRRVSFAVTERIPPTMLGSEVTKHAPYILIRRVNDASHRKL